MEVVTWSEWRLIKRDRGRTKAIDGVQRLAPPHEAHETRRGVRCRARVALPAIYDRHTAVGRFRRLLKQCRRHRAMEEQCALGSRNSSHRIILVAVELPARECALCNRERKERENVQ